MVFETVRWGLPNLAAVAAMIALSLISASSERRMLSQSERALVELREVLLLSFSEKIEMSDVN